MERFLRQQLIKGTIVIIGGHKLVVCHYGFERHFPSFALHELLALVGIFLFRILLNQLLITCKNKTSFTQIAHGEARRHLTCASKA